MVSGDRLFCEYLRYFLYLLFFDCYKWIHNTLLYRWFFFAKFNSYCLFLSLSLLGGSLICVLMLLSALQLGFLLVLFRFLL